MVNVPDVANGEAIAADLQASWLNSFIGTIPGSIGETSTLLCILGAGILIATGIGSW
jgi:Na+-transporting NADH:ubiquinone oxidoreductase subunit B